MKVVRGTVGLLFVLAVAAHAFAEEPPAPQPTAEHKELAKWVGSWSGQGDMKPGVFGAGGPMNWTETCSWFAGSEFHVVCKSEGTSPMGPSKGLGIIGYNSEKKVYTHYGVDSNGWSAYSEGTRSDDTWTFESEDTMGGKTYHTRFAMTMKSATQMDFTWEMSEDGSNWMLLMDGTSEKK